MKYKFADLGLSVCWCEDNLDYVCYDDICNKKFPRGARIPTKQDWEELINKCVIAEYQNDDFSYEFIVRKRDNKNSILLSRDIGTEITGSMVYDCIYFLTSTLINDNKVYAICFLHRENKNVEPFFTAIDRDKCCFVRLAKDFYGKKNRNK